MVELAWAATVGSRIDRGRGEAAVAYYVQESVAASVLPVFDYDMLLQSSPASGADEAAKDLNNLKNVSTMTSYWADVKLFLQRASGAATPTPPPVTWTVRASVAPTTVHRRHYAVVTATIKASRGKAALVDVETYAPNGKKRGSGTGRR